jgi:hypothetical protein
MDRPLMISHESFQYSFLVESLYLFLDLGLNHMIVPSKDFLRHIRIPGSQSFHNLPVIMIETREDRLDIHIDGLHLGFE